MTTLASATLPSNQSWTLEDINWGSWDTILQSISSSLGAIGNLVVLLVLFPQRSISRSTDTMIGSLAVADFLTSLFLLPFPRPRTVPINWLGLFYCWTLYSNALLWTCITASIYILLFICFDRYIAIAYPLKYNIYITKRRVRLGVGAIWIFSVINIWNDYHFKIDSTNQECIAEYPSEFTRFFAGSLNFIFLYVIPVLIMLITQILSARALLRQSLRFAASSHSRPTYHLAARRRVLRMMAIVVATFIITIGPNQFTYFCYNLGVMPDWFYMGVFHRFTVVLASFNSCLNPLIYAWQNKRFRQGFRGIWTKSATANAPIFGHI